jgi:hypothetical protein
MTTEITLWSPREGIKIPAKVNEPKDIASYARQLTKREMTQVIQTFESGNYELGTLFLWQKTMAGLKRQLGSLGMEFVGEMLDRPDMAKAGSPTQALTDYDAVRLAEQLGMFSPTEAMRLRQTLELVSHFSDSPQEGDEEREMMPEEAIQCLRTCIQSVLGHEQLEDAIEFARFRRDLEEKTFTVADPEIVSLIDSPYFFQRTTLRVLTSMIKTLEGASIQHMLNNVALIIPELWPQFLKPERWLVGRTYAELHNDGKKSAATNLRRILTKVKGFDYVPEDMRSRTFIEAAAKLRNIHFVMNNFYNEPSAITELENLGSVIPNAALSPCLTAILCVKLGNPYGVSWSAQGSATNLLNRLGERGWRYYLNECLPSDDIILAKLATPSIAERWNELAEEYGFIEVEIKNKNIKKLIELSGGGDSSAVSKIALSLYRRLTMKTN